MPLKFDRDIYYKNVRPLFGNKLTSEQVIGQNALLDMWEKTPTSDDPRHFAYMLATTKHETASTMMPIEEYGRGKGKPYSKVDPQTGQAYWGRGYCQLTWRDNYATATKKLGLTGEDDLEWHADRALEPAIAALVMARGMDEGWFRIGNNGKPQTLLRYFSLDTDDPYGAREIINGDKHIVPTWSNGVSIGKLIANYHKGFHGALMAAVIVEPAPEPEPEPPQAVSITITVTVPIGTKVIVKETPDGV